MAIQIYLDSNMKTAIAPANTTFTQYTTQDIELFTLKDDADTIGFNIVRPDGKGLPMVDMEAAGTELVAGVTYQKYTGQLSSYATAIMPGLGDTGTALLSFTSFILDEADAVTQRMSSPVIRLNVQRSLEPGEEPERTDRYTPLAARVLALESGEGAVRKVLYPEAKADEAITKGDVVMFSGSSGDNIRVAKATSTAVNANPKVLVGIAAENILQNAVGDIQWFGLMVGINTNSWNVGDLLYFNHAVAGGLTNVKPTLASGNKAISVAAVVKKSSGDGQIIVRPTLVDENIYERLEALEV